MKYINLFLFLLIFTFSFSQNERSTIFYNGNPVGIDTGNLIYKSETMDVQYSNIFSINQDYILERFSFFLGFDLFPDSIFAQLHQDENQSPGEIINEWQIILNENYADGYGYNIFTVNECIQLDENSSYWVTILSKGQGILKWIHTDESWPFVWSDDGGQNWSEIELNPPGANIVYGEQIYYQDPIWGDVNYDLIVNVVDIISIVQYALGNSLFVQDQIDISDLNQDGIINIVDIVSVVNIILNEVPVMTEWLLEDINNNSYSFGELIGPEVYLGNISLFYFGKAG